MNDGYDGGWTAGDPSFAIAHERATCRAFEDKQTVLATPQTRAGASTVGATGKDDPSDVRVSCRDGQISVSAPGVTIITTTPADKRAAFPETSGEAGGTAVARVAARANAAGRSAAQLITILALVSQLDAILDRA